MHRFYESLQHSDFIGLTVFGQQYFVVQVTCAEVFEEARRSRVAPREDAAARVRRRITEWLRDQGHGSKTALAEKVSGLYGEPRSPSWVTDITKNRQDLRLADLDAVAAAMGMQPGELVRHNDNHHTEITATEHRLLRFFRALPDVARHHLVAYFDYLYNLQRHVLEDQARVRDERTAAAKRELDTLKKTEKKRGA